MAFPMIGRKANVYQGDVDTGTMIAGVTAKTVTINTESVDITSDDDNGFRTLLAEASVKSIDMSVEGVTKDTVLLEASIAGNELTNYTISFDDVGDVAGNFRISSYELTGSQDDAVRFTASLESSGEYTFTAAV